ncbi:MAG: right-handed parallel beta-helix repeat-containing protein [Cyclobacteriaceae bacterium]
MQKQSQLHLFQVISTLVILQTLSACGEPGYYVSVNGSDDNPGTRNRPFKTLSKVNNLELKPGDAILLKGGETFEGTLRVSLTGTPEDSVMVASYGDGKAIIDGKNKEAIIIHGTYFRLENIHATGSGRKNGNTTNGISLKEASHGVVENIKTEGFQKSGLDLHNSQQIQVKNVVAVNNGFAGIHVGGNDKTKSKKILIKDCLADNNAGDPTNLDNHSGNGILVSMSDSVVIDHCLATNNGWDMPRIGNGPVGIWAYESSNLIFQYCISYGNKTSKGSKDGGGFDLDGGITNSIIQYCLSYDNEGAGYGLFQYAGASLWYNNVVRYCLSINDATTTEGSGGIFIWNGAEDSLQLADCIVHNNLVYATKNPAVQFEPKSLNKNFKFYNNIIIGTADVVNGPTSGEKFLGNIWWSSNDAVMRFRGFESLTSWSDATGQEMLNGATVGRQVNPLLKGPLITKLTDPYDLETLLGYTLLAQSPLINSGLKIDSLSHIPFAKKDFYGTTIPQGENPEPGVYEWEEE